MVSRVGDSGDDAIAGVAWGADGPESAASATDDRGAGDDEAAGAGGGGGAYGGSAQSCALGEVEELEGPGDDGLLYGGGDGEAGGEEEAGDAGYRGGDGGVVDLS
ncbi:MAG: hypothetical protein VXY90_14040, partial [Pseudomonadota bacterium]|nr:hypothetical protein [Pseudomonadota bacterium]MEC8585885.1 hypothetical protein [Pseudomonadota bacterium]